MIIHLNGWPGVGKQTIGKLVAEKLDAKFIHNHLLHDVAIVCAGLNAQSRWTLYEAVRSAAYDALAKQPLSEHFVMTNSLCRDDPREQAAWRHVVEMAIAKNTPLVPVVLEASEEELLRRVQDPARIGKKLSDRVALQNDMKLDTIQQPDVPELIVIDVTHLCAEEAAARIVEFVASMQSSLHPATPKHLQMKAVPR